MKKHYSTLQLKTADRTLSWENPSSIFHQAMARATPTQKTNLGWVRAQCGFWVRQSPSSTSRTGTEALAGRTESLLARSSHPGQHWYRLLGVFELLEFSTTIKKKKGIKKSLS